MQKRKFSGSISVRIGTSRVKLELSPAELHGGPAGMFRVRMARRWKDTPEGKPLFVDRANLAALLSAEAFSGEFLPEATAPDIPMGSRVSVRYWKDDLPHVDGTFTSTPPIRGHDGRFYIGVMTYRAGFFFAPVEDITLMQPNPRSGGRT